MENIQKFIKAVCVISIAGGIAAASKDLAQRRREEKRAGSEQRKIHRTNGPYERYIKRFLDFTVSSLALVALSPVALVTAILVKIKLGSPVLFAQERPGKNEKLFKLYKFRTMTDQKDENGNPLPDRERLTEFGKKLRSSSLDELPELFNILSGSMSIVGPRPLLEEYLPYYRGSERCRHDVPPGLTGLAQVSGRNHLNWDDRLRCDADYVHKITFLGDLEIILKTVSKVLKQEGVAADTDTVEAYLNVERQEDEDKFDE